MKKISLLLFAGLPFTMQSCIFIDHYELPNCFTTYYIGNKCIIALGGSSIVEESYYEKYKKNCDRYEYFIIYQEDILEDYIFEDTWGSERRLHFSVNKTNAKEGGWICSDGVCFDEKKETVTTEILPDIKLQKVDSIIIEIFYKQY
ncbi:MAG: hypothetical protein J6W13_02475 [Salinivirgaceae bacterium]|nr:hypothetical protein [Salinivirgaceae bacterium]